LLFYNKPNTPQSSVIVQSCHVHPCQTGPSLSSPAMSTLATHRPFVSSPGMSTLATPSVCVQSCNVHPCIFVGPLLSSPAISVAPNMRREILTNSQQLRNFSSDHYETQKLGNVRNSTPHTKFGLNRPTGGQDAAAFFAVLRRRPLSLLLFFRATHACSAKRGIAIVSRPSVCPSVTLMYRGRID